MSNELRRRADAYQTAKQKALKSERDDDALFWCCVAATTAWMYPFARWQDRELDELVRQIGLRLDVDRAEVNTEPKQIAHLTSLIAPGGGHIETLLLWITNVGGAVVSSEWEETNELTSELSQLTTNAHLCPTELAPALKAIWICKTLSELRPEKVLLHINPNDVVSLAGAVRYRELSGARLIYHDHVDSFFWLGASLVDQVIEIRPVGGVIARDLRHIEPSRLSLVPLTARFRNSPSVNREALGLPADATVSLTVAAYYKTNPDGHWNYADTINRILDRNPKHFHLIVGHGSSEDEQRIRKQLARDQIRLLGRRGDVDALLNISDFVIESFPLMGGLFRLDAMQAGVPIVAIAHPRWPEIFDMGVFPSDYALTAVENDEVVKYAQVLIDDKAFRNELGSDLRRHYQEHFSGPAVAAVMKQALGGQPMEILAEVAPQDTDWFGMVLNPTRVDLQAVVNWVSSSLRYTPKLGLMDRFRYLRKYVGAALSARLRHAQ
jgi:glycosyltransferase involved in cell wall biosynthesis